MIQAKILTAQEVREEKFSSQCLAGELKRRRAEEFHGAQKRERGRDNAK